jgi:hypothetical protein
MGDSVSSSLSEIPIVPCNGLPKNDAEMLACARALWNSRVEKGIEPIICLSEGFYQHDAECVSDAVQMVLCSCDYFKEVVQPLLINGTVRILKNVKPDDDIDNLITAAMPQEFLYLQGLQLRFARHYLNEYMRSKNDRAEIGPFRSKGTSGIQCATSFKYFTDESKTANVYTEKKLAGMSSRQIMKSYRDILYLFKFYDSVNIPNKQLELEEADVSSIISTYNTNNTIAMFSTARNISKPGTMSHFTVYYTCGGHEYYYDNHTGIFPFMWSSFFRWMSDAKDTIIGPDTNIRIHRVDINFLIGYGKAPQKCKYYPILEVYNDESSSVIDGTCYALFPFTKDIILLKKNKLGAYTHYDEVSGRYIKVISSLDDAYTEISVIPVIVKKSTPIKVIPRILFSRNSSTVYSSPVVFGSSSNQGVSTSNAAGIPVPPGILSDYESDTDDGVSINPPGHANQTDHRNNSSISNAINQGNQKRIRTQGGGKRKTRKHQRKVKRKVKRHTKHRS